MSDVRVHYFYEIPTYVDTKNLSTYVCTYLCKHVRTYLCMYVQMLGTYPCKYIHKEHTYLRICTYIHGYICTYYLRIYEHTYICTYAHTYFYVQFSLEKIIQNLNNFTTLSHNYSYFCLCVLGFRAV